MTDYDENKAITKEMLKSGIKAKLVTFAEDPCRSWYSLQNR